MAHIGEERVMEMIEAKKDKYRQKHPNAIVKELDIKITPNRFLISRNSYLNMIKNDITLSLFLIYSIYLPLIVGFYQDLPTRDYSFLLAFDIIFILDRFTQLLVVFINKNGIPEPNLAKTMIHNLSSSIFLEILITLFPLLLINKNKSIDSLVYFLIKLPRVIRMFESSQ